MHGQDVRNELITADDTCKKAMSGSKNAIAQGVWATYEAEKFHLLCSFVVRCWRRAKVGNRSTAMTRLKMSLCQHENMHSDFPDSDDGASERADDEVPEVHLDQSRLEPFPNSDATSSSAEGTAECPEINISQETVHDSESKDHASRQAVR